MCTYVLRSVSRASNTLRSKSHCRTLSHADGLSLRGRPRPSWWPLCHVVGAEASDLHRLSSGLPFSLGLQRPLPPSRPPHVDSGKRERSLHWFLSRGDNPGAEARFPHRLPVLPDPLSTSSSLSSVSRTRGKLWRLTCTCVLWAPNRPNRRRNKHLIVVKLDTVPEDV